MSFLNLSRIYFPVFMVLVGLAGLSSKLQAAAFPFELAPGLSIEQVVVSDKASHQLVLSAPKRVNNALRIGNSDKLDGSSIGYLLKVDSTSTSYDAFSFYSKLFTESEGVLFSCDQRACGSSNYWANTILNNRKLYGRDSDQYYLAAKTSIDNQSAMVSVYAVMNGRKQHYLYVSVLKVDGRGADAWVNGLEVKSPRISEELKSFLSAYLKNNPETYLWITATRVAEAGESFSAVDAEVSESLAQFLESFASLNDIDEARIRSRALGPFASEQSSDQSAVVFQLHLLSP